MKQTHYWLVTQTSGKTVLIYGGITEKEAYDKGLRKLDGFFEVIALPTRDVAKASQMYKGRRLEAGDGLDQSMERLQHYY